MVSPMERSVCFVISLVSSCRKRAKLPVLSVIITLPVVIPYFEKIMVSSSGVKITKELNKVTYRWQIYNTVITDLGNKE